MVIASSTLSTSLLIAALVFLGAGLLLILLAVLRPQTTTVLPIVPPGQTVGPEDVGDIAKKIADAINEILQAVPKQFRIGVLLCFFGLSLFVGAIYVESHDARTAAEKAAKAAKPS
jgi:hypothetical protein